jgi:hypothetical protein
VSTESEERLNREQIHELADAVKNIAVHNAQQTEVMLQVKEDVGSLTYQLRGNGRPGLIEIVAANGRRIDAMEGRWKNWDELAAKIRQHAGKAILGLLTLGATAMGGQVWYTMKATRVNAAQNQQIMETLDRLQLNDQRK